MIKDENGLQRRVAGYHDIRMDGMTDLVMRAKGASVFDIGCNRGNAALEFYQNGAAVVHGCDIYEPGINTAREFFADFRSCQKKFEVVDLTGGAPAVQAAFPGPFSYDIVLCLATYHKLKRVMPADRLADLIMFFGEGTKKYFAWRATSDKPDENNEEMVALDRDLKEVGLQRIHTSYISRQLGVAAIWGRI